MAESYMSVGESVNSTSVLPGVVDVSPGGTFFITQSYTFGRPACVTLRHYFNNEFGPILVSSSRVCFAKGVTDRLVPVHVPQSLAPQLWTYQTTVKWSWMHDPELLPAVRACVMLPGQHRKPTDQCPSQLNALGALP